MKRQIDGWVDGEGGRERERGEGGRESVCARARARAKKRKREAGRQTDRQTDRDRQIGR